MPFVNIKIAKGRTPEQKRALARSVTDAVAESIGASPEKIWVEINEFERENFATGGVIMADRK